MLFSGGLGFRVAAFLLLVVFPAIGLFLRRKWRLAVARKEEIHRLLVLASEEDARAELEASLGYSVANFADDVPSQRVCAVCLTPTHNRCARCKSVHYCSGKCQIIHWRQGHKDECHRSLARFENDEDGNYVGKSVKQPAFDDYTSSIESDGIKCAEESDVAEKPGFVSHLPAPLELSVKDDKIIADDSFYGEELDSLPEICGVSGSSRVHESVSDDGLCISDSISDDGSLHDLINSDSCDSCSKLENLETVVDDGNVQVTKPQEDCYIRGESDGKFPASDFPKVETFEKTTLGVSFSNSHKNSVEPPTALSGFWDVSLDCSKIRNDVHFSNGKAKIGGSGRKLSESNSLNLSGNCSPDSHSQGLEVSLDSYAGPLKSGKLVDEPSLPDKESTDVARHNCSMMLSPIKTETRVHEVNIHDGLMRSEEVKPASDASKYNGLTYHSLESLNVSGKETKDTSMSSSEETGLPLKIPSDRSSSVTKGNSVSDVKSVRAVGTSAVAPQASSPTSSATVGLKTSVLKVVGQLRAPRLSKPGVDVGRNIEKSVFPYEAFVKLYHWNKVELRPCGLINCGNSCYANVVLQCLAFTPPLTAYLLQGLHSKACAKKEWCFICEFERLILNGKEGGLPLSPIGILSQIQKIGSHLANGREEDAHEFLRYAIDTMQSIYLQEAYASTSCSLKEETTLMGLTFGGYLHSKIKCTRCHGKSERQERMMDLTVEIEGNIESLEDALRRFTRTESLDGENKYHCGRCKSYEKAKKKLSISDAPNVLTIALKRFQSGKFGKLNKAIKFPEILDLAPYMRGSNDKSPVYRLFGVVVHLDIMNAAFSGHYMCYVRNAQNKWYKIDDSMVKAVELERVLNKGAYMLFYSRLSPRAPRSIRSNIISRDIPNKMKNAKVNANHIDDDFANLGYANQNEFCRKQCPCEGDSSSDNSSIFSNNSDEVSTSTDSTRESISADDISDYIFGYNGFLRHSSDSDTSSSSSSSSSPLYMKRSPLCPSERYASSLSEPSDAHAVLVGDLSWANTPRETCKVEESVAGSGVSFLQSNSSKQVRKLVNSSSCRGADSKMLGRANALDNVITSVHPRRLS